jgi:YegS/Rv2252/BmrU family lipid kinase
MTKYKIIANPSAGSGKGKRSIASIEQLFKRFNLAYDLVSTERSWHAAELAKESALSGYDVIVAAGGDGTVNEVINGLMEAKFEAGVSATMGVLCIGRGNDFAHSMGIPYDLEQGCKTLAEDQRRTIDIGRVVGDFQPQGRFFGNCVGIGFDAIGTIEVAKLPRLGGFLSYLIAVLKTIFLYYKGPVVAIDYDNHTLTQPTLLVSIMNGIRLGGGFYMAPDAEPDDGLFDLVIADQVGRPRIFGLLPHFLRGTQGTQKEIKTDRAARISIEAVEGSLPAQTDGEILSVDGKQLEIELLPHQIEIIYQPQSEIK